jgi:hypothetical protein
LHATPRAPRVLLKAVASWLVALPLRLERLSHVVRPSDIIPHRACACNQKTRLRTAPPPSQSL